MNISLSVMAHHSRSKHFDYLKEKLHNPPFAIDKGDFGIWENAKRAWRLYDPSCGYHIVVQDDAIIHDDFLPEAESLIHEHPNSAYCFYMAENLKSLCGKLQKPYIKHDRVHWGVAIGLPTKHIEPMIKAGDKLTQYGNKHDDTRISRYCQQHDLDVFYMNPCYIDHRHGKSLIGDSGTRHAYNYAS
jgi:hypothetical protein